jgi:hypothetical protein
MLTLAIGSSNLPPPFPMSLVCSENIVNYCSLDQSLLLGKTKCPVSVDSIGGDQKSTASEKTESTDLDQLLIVTQSPKPAVKLSGERATTISMLKLTIGYRTWQLSGGISGPRLDHHSL